MARRSFRRQLAAFVVVTATLTLSLGLLYSFEDSIAAYFREQMAVHVSERASERASLDWALTLIKLVLWLCLIFVLVRAAGELIFGIIFRLRRGFEAPGLVRNIFSIVANAILFAITVKRLYPSVDFGTLFTTSAIFGVIIGLALQDTLGNLFAGVSLQADRPFQVGDVIAVGNFTGVVQSITWRAVKIRTFQNHLVMLSNSSIAKEPIEVCPRENLNARLVFFNTLYTDSPAKTIHVVREAVREADNVSRKITPIVRIRNLGDNGIDWEVKYWLDDYAKYNDTDALVRQLIWYAFRRAGLNFAYPTRTLYVERPAKGTGARRDGKQFIDRLAAVDIFAPLTEAEVERLAQSTASRVFAPGEAIIRAGDEGSSMFVVHRGRVKVEVSDGGKPRTVAALMPGDFFGEMALFTGEPRTANVVAAEETEVLEIGHDAMKHLFDTNPDLVESLGHIIAERKIGLQAVAADPELAKTESAGVLAAIKRFFRLN